MPKMDAAALINAGSQCEHWMFVTPNDDDHFMLFTADNYRGPEENFFDKLKTLRAKETPVAGSEAVRQAQVHAVQRQRA